LNGGIQIAQQLPVKIDGSYIIGFGNEVDVVFFHCLKWRIV
jgi:hypothetical protein